MHANLEVVTQLLPGLWKLLGKRYEVILHDMGTPQGVTVWVGGNVTQSEIGEPAPQAVLRPLQEFGDSADNCIHCKNPLPDGRLLRTSTLFIRDEGGKVIGALSLNQDVTDFIVARNVIEEGTSFIQPETIEFTGNRDIYDAMESVVDAEVAQLQKSVALMQKDDKIAIVEKLEQKGVFAIKNAVEYVADRLGVTNYTVYNYIKEARGINKTH